MLRLSGIIIPGWPYINMLFLNLLFYTEVLELKYLNAHPSMSWFLFSTCTSRFGKFVELQFDERGRISGAAVRTYLLERSRVCQISTPERNYHCFYMLCAAPPEVLKI